MSEGFLDAIKKVGGFSPEQQAQMRDMELDPENERDRNYFLNLKNSMEMSASGTAVVTTPAEERLRAANSSVRLTGDAASKEGGGQGKFRSLFQGKGKKLPTSSG